MHPRITELLNYIDRQGRVLHAAYDAVPAAGRAARPAPGRWSAAEVVDHVTLVNRSLVRAVRRLIEQASALPHETETSPVMPTLDIARIIERARRLKAVEAVQPKNADPARIWESFETAQRELKEVIASADGLAMSAVSAQHPALGKFNGYEWIAFAGAHAARHAAQIREIVDKPPARVGPALG